MLKRRALITNYTGIGDALILLPLLKTLEKELVQFQYFYFYNSVFTTQEWIKYMGIKNLLGLYPVEWRHFYKLYWTDITAFLEQNNVDLIINLRDENCQSNPDYYQYKEIASSSKLEFWDIEHKTFSEPRHFIQDTISLFQQHSIDLSIYDQYWLKAYFDQGKNIKSPKHHIGFFTATSMAVKSWSAENWVELGNKLLNSSDSIIVVYAGALPSEIAFAHSIVSALHRKYPAPCCKVVTGRNLTNLAKSFSSLDLLVANDTFAVHLAAALELPTVGLYFATDGRIWGGNSRTFISVQSNFGLKCHFMKKNEGKCIYYFGGCSAPCKQEVTPQRVYASVSSLLSKMVILR